MLSWLFTALIPAYDRIPDIVLYNGSIFHLNNTYPFDSFLAGYQLYPKYGNAPMMVTRRGQMDGTENPNFHIANWIIEDERLYLSSIDGFVYPNFDAWYLESIEKSLDSINSEDERRQLTIEISHLKQKGVRLHVVNAMDYFFPNRIPGQPIFAYWFSGELDIRSQIQNSYTTTKPRHYKMTFFQGVLQSVKPL